MCTGLADHVTSELALVAAEVVHDDNITRPEGWRQDLLDIGFEAVAVDRATDGEGSRHAVKPEGGSGQTSPAEQCLAFLEPAPEPGHVGLDPGLVDEDKA